MRTKPLVLAIVFVIAVFVGYHLGSGSKHTHKAVAMKRLKPVCEGDKCHGTYAYQDNDVWWIYQFTMDSGSSTSPYARYGASLPSGGQWVRSTSAPKEEEVEDEQETEVNEDANGEPETAEDAAVEAEADVAESSDTSVDSGDSSADSGDAGGGGDSGGDAGGGDGGGGGE